ncbi:MAG: hypothetical protein AAGC73_03435 [Verrucomicrobiota bacterium]
MNPLHTVKAFALCLIVQFANAETFQTALEAYENGEYEAAFAGFSTAAETEESAAARHNLALAAFQSGQISEAVWQLERATLLDPQNHEYIFKLGALRQELGLLEEPATWYQLAAAALTLNQWILVTAIIFWALVLSYFIPWMRSEKAGILSKLCRTLCLIILCLAVPALWLSFNGRNRGILITEQPLDLHAAPAAAAPVSGSGRPGERATLIQVHHDFCEIETESKVRGWVSSEKFRPLIFEETDT